MPDQFRRTLPDEVTVSVEGHYPPDHPGDRSPAQIVVTMPDYVADGLAHLLADFSYCRGVLGGDDRIGIDGAALAVVLWEAATSGDYQCPEGRLRLSPTTPAVSV